MDIGFWLVDLAEAPPDVAGYGHVRMRASNLSAQLDEVMETPSSGAFEAWLHGVLLPFLDGASDRRGLAALHASGAFQRALVHKAARRTFEAA